MTAAQQAADEAIDRGATNADQDWVSAAWTALMDLAATREPFLADDVVLSSRLDDLRTHDHRALGGILRSAAKQGLIKPTGEWRPSGNVKAHNRPCRVWIGA